MRSLGLPWNLRLRPGSLSPWTTRIINASERERVALYLDNMSLGRWHVTLRNCYLEQVSGASLEVKGGTYAFDLAIPRGGLAELRKQV